MVLKGCTIPSFVPGSLREPMMLCSASCDRARDGSRRPSTTVDNGRHRKMPGRRSTVLPETSYLKKIDTKADAEAPKPSSPSIPAISHTLPDPIKPTVYVHSSQREMSRPSTAPNSPVSTLSSHHLLRRPPCHTRASSAY